jgi:hypothetical protein
MEEPLSYYPIYNPNFCRVCENPLTQPHRDEHRVMHPECEEKWLALKPFPPCKFCEAVLSLDDVAAKRTLHPHCEMELSPDFRLPEEVAP